MEKMSVVPMIMGNNRTANLMIVMATVRRPHVVLVLFPPSVKRKISVARLVKHPIAVHIMPVRENALLGHAVQGLSPKIKKVVWIFVVHPVKHRIVLHTILPQANVNQWDVVQVQRVCHKLKESMFVAVMDIHRIVAHIIQVLENAMPHLVHHQLVHRIVAHIHQRPQKLVHLVPVAQVR